MTERAVFAGARLGKLKPRLSGDDLMLARFLGVLPTAPKAVTYSSKVSAWPIYLNDSLGDCAIADPAHTEQLWTAQASKEVRVSDTDVLKAYCAVSGYSVGHPETDRGCVMGNVMDYWRKTGIGGHRIAGYTAVVPRHRAEMKQAVWIFGAVHLGLALPLSAQTQVGKTWRASSGPRSAAGSWGGHAVPIVDYDALGATCVTWGRLQRMTWGFLERYADEAFAAFSPEWLTLAAKAPNGFDVSALTADLGEFSH